MNMVSVSVLFTPAEPHPHRLVGVAGLRLPLLPLAAQQLLSKAFLDDGVGI